VKMRSLTSRICRIRTSAGSEKPVTVDLKTAN
jgi:hypothetical protein